MTNAPKNKATLVLIVLLFTYGAALPTRADATHTVREVILSSRHVGAHGLGYNSLSLHAMSSRLSPRDIPNVLRLYSETDMAVGVQFALASLCRDGLEALMGSVKERTFRLADTQSVDYSGAQDSLSLIAGSDLCDPSTRQEARAAQQEIDVIRQADHRKTEQRAKRARVESVPRPEWFFCANNNDCVVVGAGCAVKAVNKASEAAANDYFTGISARMDCAVLLDKRNVKAVCVPKATKTSCLGGPATCLSPPQATCVTVSPTEIISPLTKTGTVMPCTEAQAIEAARKASTQYCAGKNGCDFKARLQTKSLPIATPEKDQTVETWVITVSQIHSFDPEGKPRFMPEGSRFVSVGIGKGGCSGLAISGFVLRPPGRP